MACRTVLDTLFHALVRWAAPVLVFTAEEVWGTRFPEGGSVHLLEWPVLPTTTLDRHPGEGRGPTDLTASTQGQLDPGLRRDDELVGKWMNLRSLRAEVNEAIEPMRRDKLIGSSLQASVSPVSILERVFGVGSDSDNVELAELAIVSEFGEVPTDLPGHVYGRWKVSVTTHHKCGRCWRHLPEVTEDGALCSRCDQVVAGMDAAHG